MDLHGVFKPSSAKHSISGYSEEGFIVRPVASTAFTEPTEPTVLTESVALLPALMWIMSALPTAVFKSHIDPSTDHLPQSATL
ncbi:uncharacterized protein N7506_006949 [Penicillium brevicompactum]|uniref:uncharacterized protein n=1 Tax=Penicillium brevicompactum TaxID=5074 RepID=UPI002540EE9F|nr:uncharacterized protein N7506_006949 [Penicillium brevicompactum]KAJ5333166.1 hypothetical protein N7506_006949 [Penicillium brevicompactum]